jgi:hypothetical protein
MSTEHPQQHGIEHIIRHYCFLLSFYTALEGVAFLSVRCRSACVYQQLARCCYTLKCLSVKEQLGGAQRTKQQPPKQWHRRSIGISSASTCAQCHVAVSAKYPVNILYKLRQCRPIELRARRSTLSDFSIGQSGS